MSEYPSQPSSQHPLAMGDLQPLANHDLVSPSYPAIADPVWDSKTPADPSSAWVAQSLYSQNPLQGSLGYPQQTQPSSLVGQNNPHQNQNKEASSGSDRIVASTKQGQFTGQPLQRFQFSSSTSSSSSAAADAAGDQRSRLSFQQNLNVNSTSNPSTNIINGTYTPQHLRSETARANINATAGVSPTDGQTNATLNHAPEYFSNSNNPTLDSLNNSGSLNPSGSQPQPESRTTTNVNAAETGLDQPNTSAPFQSAPRTTPLQQPQPFSSSLGPHVLPPSWSVAAPHSGFAHPSYGVYPGEIPFGMPAVPSSYSPIPTGSPSPGPIVDASGRVINQIQLPIGMPMPVRLPVGFQQQPRMISPNAYIPAHVSFFLFLKGPTFNLIVILAFWCNSAWCCSSGSTR